MKYRSRLLESLRMSLGPGTAGSGRVLVQVSTPKFDQSWSNDPDYIPEGGEEITDGRYAKLQKLAADGSLAPVSCEAPVVDLNGATGEVNVLDGRHRIAVFRDQGFQTLGIAVPREQAEEVTRRFS
jgi:hypothetical protein